MFQVQLRGGLILVAVTVGASSLLATPPRVSTSNETTAPAQSNLVIRQKTNRVLVDVVVTDQNGKPVRGLTKGGFVVKEDGKRQRVLSFDVEDVSRPDFVPPKLPPLPTNTFVNVPQEPERGPLYVLVYDMVNTDLEFQATTYNPLLKFIDSKPEGTRFAIYANTDGLHLLQGFTSDRELLRAAITSRGPGPHIPNQFLNGNSYGKDNSDSTVEIFNFLAQYLQGIPGRKNLIWMSSGLSVALSPISGQYNDSESVKRALESMMHSQIAVYPVDLKGVTIGSPGGSNLASDALASFTGGHAYYSDNDIRAALGDAVDHGATYYTLSYSPTNEKLDYAARHIAVKVGKKGYQLTYRQVYYALPDGATEQKKLADTPDARFMAAKENDTLYADIEHGAPMLHDLLFRAHVGAAGVPAMATTEQMANLQDEPAYFRTGRKNQTFKPLAPVKLQKYLIDYTVLDGQLKAFAERAGMPAALEFAAVAYDAEGRMLNGIANDALSSAPASADGKTEVKFRVRQEFDVPPGAAWLRLAVRDKMTGRTGTLEAQLPLKAEPGNQAANSGN